MKTETGFNYGRYLASREWALLKKQVRLRSGGLCERCKLAPYEETHHLTYERIGRERLEDIEARCRACHAFESAESAFDPLSPPSLENPAYRSLLTPIAKIADPAARKSAAIHLANTLKVPPSLFLEQLHRIEEGA